MEVAVQDDDVLSAGSVGLPRHGARDVSVLHEAHDDHVLAGLDVRTHPYRELGVSPNAIRRHEPGRRSDQSPQSKSRGRPVQSASSRAAPSTSSTVSSPGHGSRSELSSEAGSPSNVSSIRACSSLLNSGWFSSGSPSR